MNNPRDLEAELLRAVLSTTAHDLGGLASALSLRADVLERVATTSASTALRRIADELRTLGHDVRAFRSAEGGDTLSPARSGSLQQWLARVQRYGRPLLPRGSTLDGSVPDIVLEAATALELTFVALAVLQQIAVACVGQRVVVRIDAQTQNTNVGVIIQAHMDDEPLMLSRCVEGEWWQWALARAAASSMTLQLECGQACLTVPILQEQR